MRSLEVDRQLRMLPNSRWAQINKCDNASEDRMPSSHDEQPERIAVATACATREHTSSLRTRRADSARRKKQQMNNAPVARTHLGRWQQVASLECASACLALETA